MPFHIFFHFGKFVINIFPYYDYLLYCSLYCYYCISVCQQNVCTQSDKQDVEHPFEPRVITNLATTTEVEKSEDSVRYHIMISLANTEEAL